MIGQRELINKIGNQIGRDRFPRFSIFVGEAGSGKKTLAREVTRLGLKVAGISFNDSKVESVRSVIISAYTIEEPMLYVFTDCDNMSSAAANALLKVTEEPPRNAYFILTCENDNNLLPTIRSRGVTYMLEPYSYEDKCDYIEATSPDITPEDEEYILEVATTIREVQTMLNMDIAEFRDYVKLVTDNVAEVQVSNAFKIGSKIAFKDEADKYDLGLFWKAFRCECLDRARASVDDQIMYSRASAVTGYIACRLNHKGVNKQELFDVWILDVREAMI